MISVAGSFVTHPSFLVGMYSWLFDSGWNFPFYSVSFLTCKFWLFLAGLFLISLIILLFKLYLFENPNH